MLPREHRLKKSSEFNNVYQKGKHLKGKFGQLIFLSLGNDSASTPSKIGIVVSSKVGKAFKRNKIKRQIRNIFHSNISELPTGLLISYIVWPGDFTFDEMKSEIMNLVEKMLSQLEKR